jgi:hypothetical protein
MRKKEYLDKTTAFVDHIVQVATSADWPRQFYDRGRGQVWQCTSLLDAVENYQYGISQNIWQEVMGDGTTPTDLLASNTQLLAALGQRLRDARRAADEGSAHGACVLILRWGGVYNRGKKEHQNQARLEGIRGRAGGLLGYLKTVDAGLAKDTDDFEPLCTQVPDALYCNAGFTKIYSLMSEDFVIYDSRVAAALGLLVVGYCQANNYDTVPKELKFMWMPASSSENAAGNRIPNQQRNPRVNNLKFAWRPPRARSDTAFFRHNIRANWLLSTAIAAKTMQAWWAFASTHDITALRALEAALFMVGYDLNPAARPV